MRSTSLSRLATLMLGIFGIAVTNKLDICLDTCNEKVSEEYQKIKYVMCSTFNARWNGCYYLFIGMACMPNLFKTAIHCIKWSCQIPSQFFFFVSGYIYWTAQKGLCRPRRMSYVRHDKITKQNNKDTVNDFDIFDDDFSILSKIPLTKINKQIVH